MALSHAVKVADETSRLWKDVTVAETPCWPKCLLVLLGAILEIVLFSKPVTDAAHGGEIWLPSWPISRGLFLGRPVVLRTCLGAVVCEGVAVDDLFFLPTRVLYPKAALR